MSTGTAALAQLLAVGGLLLLAAKEISRRRAAIALGLIVLGVLSYESVGVLAIPVALALRWESALRVGLRLVGAICVVAAGRLRWGFHLTMARPHRSGLTQP